jgi:Tol biopolymer transport system component
MTHQPDFDVLVTAWFQAEAPPKAPNDLAEMAIARIARTARRPGWRLPERWLSMQATARLTVVRPAFAVLILVALLIAAFLAALLVGPSTHPSHLGRNGVIAFDSAGDIYVTGADARHAITNGAAIETNPTFSPDGKRLAYWAQPDAATPGALVVADGDGGNARTLVEGVGRGDQGDPIVWLPDSSRILYTFGQRLYGISVDGGAPIALSPPGRDVHWPTVSPDGSTVAFRSDALLDGGIYLMTIDARVIRRIDTGGEQLWQYARPDWAPDGRRLAYVAGSNGRVLYTAAADGSGAVRVSDPYPTSMFWPSWSPDGDRIAAVVGSHVVVVGVDGGGTRTFDDRDVDPFAVRWSPDGQKLFASGGSAQWIVIYDVATQHAEVIDAPGNLGSGSWQWLAP